ncbi:MAG: hypothetical protein E7566_08465 [Ruminococcaceae bacterium]|nr:hypothetical protein [Oscillospiraceae bacterium]
MKKSIALLLTSLLMLLCLCACNSQEEASTTTAETHNEPSEAITTEAPKSTPATFDEVLITEPSAELNTQTLQPNAPFIDEIPDENKVVVEWVDDYDPFDE